VHLYNLPVFKQLIELLHWILVSLNDALASLGLGPNWSWGLAIIGLTIIVRLVLFPLTWKQFSSARSMQAIQPLLKELQKKYKGDRAKLQQETMKLYQEHRVNPFASCLPLLLQLPVFMSLYYAIRGTPYLDPATTQALSNASFLWIPHLGQPDPTYILLVLYVGTQLISTELMLTYQTDKQQKWIMRAMPIMFVFFLWRFPAGLFVYWVTTNLWTIGQQLLIRKYMKPFVPASSSDPAAAGTKRVKRSRIMDVIMSAAQGDDVKTREDLVRKLGKSGKKPGATADNAEKPATKPATKPAGRGAKQGGAKPAAGGAKQGGAKPAAGGAKQGGAKPAARKGGRKPPPGKRGGKPGTQPGAGKKRSDPSGG
jgi:YidC/Oxa1 family membrane protein insertase